MKNGPCKLDVTKMTRALRHPLTASLTLEISVDGTHARIHEATHLRLMGSLIHDLRMFDFCNRVRFLMKSVSAKQNPRHVADTHDFLG